MHRHACRAGSEDLRPRYFEDLCTRVTDAILNAEISVEGGVENPAAPIQSPSGHGVEFWDLEDAYLIE